MAGSVHALPARRRQAGGAGAGWVTRSSRPGPCFYQQPTCQQAPTAHRPGLPGHPGSLSPTYEEALQVDCPLVSAQLRIALQHGRRQVGNVCAAPGRRGGSSTAHT